MKNAIKKILTLSTLCVTCFTFASCSLINLGSGGGSIFEEKIDYSEYRKDYDNTNPFGGSGIYEKTDKTNEFGLDDSIYGNSVASQDWEGGNNGSYYIGNIFDIVTPIYTEKYLEDSLKEAKEKIASENMSVNYKTLFNNKTYTNSNISHELSIENTVGLNSYIEFEEKMFKAFDDAIARKENFLIYCSEYTYDDGSYGDEGLEPGQYGKPFAYGYVEGLGYIIISTTYSGSITISVENKYFTRIDIDNNISTWYSNEDAIKIPIARNHNTKGIFWDYSPNMIRATTYGLFSENSDDYTFEHTRFAFTEGDYLGIGGIDNALHLYGARTESKYTKNYINNDLYFYSKDYLGGYLTDFNNFFYGDNTYALFGELADSNLKKIVNAMFSIEMQPCNDFEEECNWNDIVIRTDSNPKYIEQYGIFGEIGTMSNLIRIVDYFNLDLIQELNYSYPNDDWDIYPFSDGNYYYFTDVFDSRDKQKWYNWYNSLEVKPYIKSYENIDGDVTVRNWSFNLGKELNMADFNIEMIKKNVGLTIEGFDREDYIEYKNSMSSYGFSNRDGVKGWYIQITDENNVFRLRFEN